MGIIRGSVTQQHIKSCKCDFYSTILFCIFPLLLCQFIIIIIISFHERLEMTLGACRKSKSSFQILFWRIPRLQTSSKFCFSPIKFGSDGKIFQILSGWPANSTKFGSLPNHVPNSIILSRAHMIVIISL